MLKIWKMVVDQCPDWHLQILGSGNEQRVKSLIQRYKIKNVEVTGFVSPFEYYDKASILCATSTTEGWGMVLVEAQSRGCVPVAFDSYASVRDIITDEENGLLVAPFNLREYARKLIELMTDDDRRIRMAKRGLDSAQRFGIDPIARQWITLFNRLYE